MALDRRNGERVMRVLLTLETALTNLRDETVTTKRGLFYEHEAKLSDPNAHQGDSDRALATLANLIGVRRTALGFVEARRGLLWGRLVVRIGEQVIDASQLGRGGLGIPRIGDGSEIVGSDAAFILVVEKQAIGIKLADAKVWERFGCILVCGEGFPSLSTRAYVRTLVDTLGIPAFICVDGDPWGIRVALTYAHGSISTALETPRLACNNVWLAGVYPSELDAYYHPHWLIRFEETDYEAARQLIEHPSLAYIGQRLRDEMALLVERGAKAELDALCHERRLMDDYLPKKLFDSDLVKL